jgi:hypothetical protein
MIYYFINNGNVCVKIVYMFNCVNPAFQQVLLEITDCDSQFLNNVKKLQNTNIFSSFRPKNSLILSFIIEKFRNYTEYYLLKNFAMQFCNSQPKGIDVPQNSQKTGE